MEIVAGIVGFAIIIIVLCSQFWLIRYINYKLRIKNVLLDIIFAVFLFVVFNSPLQLLTMAQGPHDMNMKYHPGKYYSVILTFCIIWLIAIVVFGFITKFKYNRLRSEEKSDKI
jgi:hypothetical protein